VPVRRKQSQLLHKVQRCLILGKWGKAIGSHEASSRFVRNSHERSKSRKGRFTNFENAASNIIIIIIIIITTNSKQREKAWLKRNWRQMKIGLTNMTERNVSSS
jgi:hypothetical protein